MFKDYAINNLPAKHAEVRGICLMNLSVEHVVNFAVTTVLVLCMLFIGIDNLLLRFQRWGKRDENAAVRAVSTLIIIVVIVFTALLMWLPEAILLNVSNRVGVNSSSGSSASTVVNSNLAFYSTVNSIRDTLAKIFGGVVGGIFIAATTLFAWRKLRVAEEGHIADRYFKAIEKLNKNDEPSFLGGVYALGRIAKDSEKDCWKIMRLFSAIVRQYYSTSDDVEMVTTEELNNAGRVSADSKLQAIFNEVVDRSLDYPSPYDGSKQYDPHFDYGKCDLRYLDLRGCNAENFGFYRTFFFGARLQGVNFRGAYLRRANFLKADLSKAILDDADVSYADFRAADGLTEEQLLKAKNLHLAQLPEKLIYLNRLNKLPFTP